MKPRDLFRKDFMSMGPNTNWVDNEMEKSGHFLILSFPAVDFFSLCSICAYVSYPSYSVGRSFWTVNFLSRFSSSLLSF